MMNKNVEYIRVVSASSRNAPELETQKRLCGFTSAYIRGT